ncbi:hypothetical protein [Candidatus Formimonas warabiya]|uniref:Uncharacterized protein n=1 Tax=Formimonas warabiya TaxID=1761012 RepID=A0A3G1KX66_FORW1|nr:hypothetical protein [Candidatus Formimonas warabiya]ATW26987.1 hypothetical protein DCMF_21455 [Candidatus Formimonas warabiya]
MNWLWAGILAAVAAWQLNKIIVRFWGEWGTIWITPAVEETVKTTGAFVLGADLILTHGFFGAIEALYDLKTSRRRGFSAALASLLGHLVFGMAAQGAWTVYGSLFAAVAFGTMGHLAWNVLISMLTKRKRIP